MVIFNVKWQKVITLAGTIFLTSSIYLSDAIAQSLPRREILIAQTFDRIQRKIPLSEVPLPVMASVKTITGAEPKAAGVEMKSDGSIVYELSGQNQQGFKFIVDTTPNGTIVEVDEEIDRTAVPENVMNALKKWSPNAKIVNIWKSTRLGEFVYEIVLDNDFWFEITADADTVTIRKLLPS
ncbi:MAG: hypothetical protein MJK14_26710 [Rivularia sp. ALOHA_DT_140]|nr:hypothetical protein [Rivularia sp. ALOHA_DT_140]